MVVAVLPGVNSPRRVVVRKPGAVQAKPTDLFAEVPPLPKRRGFIGRCCCIIADDIRKKLPRRMPTNGSAEKWEDWEEYFKVEHGRN